MKHIPSCTYLAAVPGASNEDTVRKEIDRLDETVRSKVRAIANTAADFSERGPNPSLNEKVANVFDRLGDFTRAKEMMTARNPKREAMFWREDAFSQALRGNLEGARKAAGMLEGALRSGIMYSDWNPDETDCWPELRGARTPEISAKCDRKMIADEEVNNLWGSMLNTYFNEFSDFETSRQIAELLRPLAGKDDLRRNALASIDDERTNYVLQPVVWWAHFARNRAQSEPLAIGLKPDTHIAGVDDTSSNVENLQSASLMMLGTLNEERTMERLFARQKADCAAVVGSAATAPPCKYAPRTLSSEQKLSLASIAKLVHSLPVYCYQIDQPSCAYANEIRKVFLAAGMDEGTGVAELPEPEFLYNTDLVLIVADLDKLPPNAKQVYASLRSAGLKVLARDQLLAMALRVGHGLTLEECMARHQIAGEAVLFADSLDSDVW